MPGLTRFLSIATAACVIMLAGCAATNNTQDMNGSNGCPAGQERICKSSSQRSSGTGNRLEKTARCNCETVEAS